MFGSHHSPTRERGTDLRRFRDVFSQSLAHASGCDTAASFTIRQEINSPVSKGLIASVAETTHREPALTRP